MNTNKTIFHSIFLFSILLNTTLVQAEESKEEPVILQGTLTKAQDENYEQLLAKNDTLIVDLDTVLSMAEDKNLRIDIQEYSVKEAKDRLIGSSAEFLPSLGLVNYLRQRDGTIQIFGNSTLPIQQKSVEPRMYGSFGFFQGGRVLFGWISSKKSLDAEKKKLSDTQQNILTEVANTYFLVQRYGGELESELARLKQAEQNLREREIALKIGEDIKLSVLLAQQEVEEAKARVASLKEQFYSKSSDLNQLLNVPTGVLIIPFEKAHSKKILTWERDPQLPELIDFALLNRPDLSAQKLLIDSQRARQAQSVSAFLPTVTVNGSLGLIGPNYPRARGDEQLALTIQYDSLRNLGGAGLSSYLQAKHAKDKLKLQFSQSVKDLESDIASAYLAVISSTEAFRASQAALVSAEESYRQAMVRLKEGVGTSFELTVATTGLERARGNYFDSVANNQIAQVNLLKTLGLAERKNIVDGYNLSTFSASSTASTNTALQKASQQP